MTKIPAQRENTHRVRDLTGIFQGLELSQEKNQTNLPYQAHKKSKILALFLLLAFCTAIIFLSFHSKQSDHQIANLPPPPHPLKNSLQNVRERGSLRVLTRNTLGTYFEGPARPAGFEYELVKSFADTLDVELELTVVDEYRNVIPTLLTGKFDLAAANLAVTPEYENDVRFGWPYLQTTTQVVFRNGSAKPGGPEDLVGKQVIVMHNPSHLRLLNEWKVEHPGLTWSEVDGDVDLLVRLLFDNEADYALMDSIDTLTEKRLFPELRVGFDASMEEHAVSWAYPNDTDGSLMRIADEHLQQMRTYGRLMKFRDDYFDRNNELDYYSTREFVRDVHEILPLYEPAFREAGDRFDIEWQILAAMSYQESHWMPDAVSPTGVKGIMMLTNKAATDLGIADRTDPYQSIMGGAEYFSGIYNRLPDSITDPDRLWVALAAYNVGLGHIYDVRRLLRRRGKNPDSWIQIKQHLPLLSQPEIYETLKYGYARGHEPVAYVDNILNYYEMLVWHTSKGTVQIANQVDVDINLQQLGL